MLLENLIREEIYSLLGFQKSTIDGFWFVDTPLVVYLILNIICCFLSLCNMGVIPNFVLREVETLPETSSVYVEYQFLFCFNSNFKTESFNGDGF